jgi:serine/threonine-protein kinase
MGTVYRARDTRSGALVALKVLKDDVAEDPELARRFELEANTLRRLDHENIVRLLGYGSDDGAYFIAMELVEGESLAQRLRREGRLPGAEVRRIGIAVAAALEAAHGQRIIHRDIKPGNILLGADGSVKVSDFGVARVLDETRRTRTGTFLGSLAYAAPEAFDGRADERSDLYSLGCVLFECFSGKTPFRAETPVKMLELHRWETPDIGAVGLSEPQRALVEELLEKQPRRRPASAREVLAVLVSMADSTAGAEASDESPTVVASAPVASAPVAPTEVIPPTPPRSEVRAAPGRSFSRRNVGVLAGLGGLALAGMAAMLFAGPFSSAGDGGEQRLAGGGTASATASATVEPTGTPAVVGGFAEQRVLHYAGRTLTVSVSCGEGEGLRGLPALDPETAVVFDLLTAQSVPRYGAPGYDFAIDVVFVDETKRVTAVFPGIQAGELTASSETPVRYAIELAEGGAALHQLTPGTGLAFQTPCQVRSQREEPTEEAPTTEQAATSTPAPAIARCGEGASAQLVVGAQPGQTFHDGDQLSATFDVIAPGCTEVQIVFYGYHTPGTPWYDYFCVVLSVGCGSTYGSVIYSGERLGGGIPLATQNGRVTLAARPGTVPPPSLGSPPSLEGFHLCGYSVGFYDVTGQIFGNPGAGAPSNGSFGQEVGATVTAPGECPA